jgi:cytoskeletal protein CcmA (bactofilin family)
MKQTRKSYRLLTRNRMFGSKKQEFMSHERGYSMGGQQTASTIIAHGVKVEGDFSSQGDVLIEGEVHGKVATSGTLSVGAQAVLRADVSAEKALIAGSIEGNLNVASHLDLKATAKINGDVQCETATVESGATLSGKVVIGRSAVPQKNQGRTKAPNAHDNDLEDEQENG